MVRNSKGAASILQLWYYPGQAAEDAWSHLLGNSQHCHHHLGLQEVMSAVSAALTAVTTTTKVHYA